MKIVSCTVAALIASTCLASPPSNSPASAQPADIVHVSLAANNQGYTLFADGDTALQVMGAAGMPHQILPGGVWVYFGCAASNNLQAARGKCTTMLVSFTPGPRLSQRKVCAIVLVNDDGWQKTCQMLDSQPGFLAERFRHAGRSS